MEETKYYVFDCDTDLYKLSQKINNIFKTIQGENPTIICIKHGYADMIVYGDCSCCLFPHNEISIACGANDITFNTTNKILKLEINKDISMYSNIYNVKIEIIYKG